MNVRRSVDSARSKHPPVLDPLVVAEAERTRWDQPPVDSPAGDRQDIEQQGFTEESPALYEQLLETQMPPRHGGETEGRRGHEKTFYTPEAFERAQRMGREGTDDGGAAAELERIAGRESVPVPKRTGGRHKRTSTRK